MRGFLFWLGTVVVVGSAALVSCKKAPGEGCREAVEQAGYELTPEGFLRAAEGDDLKALEAMLGGGMSLETTDPAGRTALHAAAGAGSVQAATFLLDRGLAIDGVDASGRTPLMEAVTRADPEMVKFLLRQGADPTLKDGARYKPLMLAVREGRADMVAELAPYVRQDLDDALLAAAILGQAEVIDELTNYGASIYARVEDGRTPLMLAAQHGRVEAVEMLLDIGANRFTLDSAGRIAADLAREAGHVDLAARLSAEPVEGEFELAESADLGDEMAAEVDARRESDGGSAGGPGDDGSAALVVGVDPESVEAEGGGVASGEVIEEPDSATVGGTGSATAGGSIGGIRDAAAGRRGVPELEGVVVGGGPTEPPPAAPPGRDRGPAGVGGAGGAGVAADDSAAAAAPPVVMRAYRQSELPLRVDSTAGDRAVIQVVGGARHELAVGDPVPGSRLKVVRITRKMQSGKENEGEPVEVSVVTLGDEESGVVRELTVGLPALAHEPVALVEDATTGNYYVARTGQRFRTADGGDFLVGDVRPNQIVLEDMKTGETRTIPLSGPRG